MLQNQWTALDHESKSFDTRLNSVWLKGAWKGTKQRIWEQVCEAEVTKVKFEVDMGKIGGESGGESGVSAPKSQRFLRFAIAMPIADPRNRAISETRESDAALRFKSAMESR